MTQAQQAQKFREQQEEMRRRHIDELRSKDMDRRAQVDYSCILDLENLMNTYISSGRGEEAGH